ncbi:MAG: thioredoxin domain-containing protein, partial [Nitrosopumilaceae archaeon]
MKKKGIVIGVIVAIIVIGAAASYSSSSIEYTNLDMSRTHGTVSTAMGSPVLGDPDAPITIVEFGDYQCHACYNWFHTHKPAIYENYIATGKANLVFVDLAFLGRDSPTASQASYCAEDQGM